MSIAAKTDAFSGLIPFVIGATGHRDLCPEDVPLLKEKVRGVAEKLAERLKATPLLLLSGLAEGADQLVAEVALSAGIGLVVVLPMPMEIYIETMSEEARQQFTALFSRAALKIELPLNGVSGAHLATSESARVDQYRALAIFLATHSQALIALWDGVDGKTGGTAEVVDYVRNGIPHHRSAAKGRALRGTVYHIVTPRRRHSKRLANAFSVQLLTADDQSRSQSAAVASSLEENIDRFNRDAAQLKPDDPLLEPLIPKGQPRIEWPYLQRISECYSYANALAMKHQRHRRLYLAAILAFSLLGFGGLEVHSDIVHWNWLWLVYPVSILFAFALYRASEVGRIESRFHESRALAEALRVQFYWGLSGIHEAVSNHYVFHDPSEIGWMVAATRGLTLFAQEPPKLTGSQENEHIRATLDRWIVGQADWFDKSSKTQHSAVERLEGITSTALTFVVGFSLLLALAVLIPTPWQPAWSHWINDEFRDKIHFLIVTPSIALGLFKIWIEQAAYDEQARNYRRMSLLFARGAETLRECLEAGNMSQARVTIKDLGIRALEENSIWLIMHRERPLKVFSGN